MSENNDDSLYRLNDLAKEYGYLVLQTEMMVADGGYAAVWFVYHPAAFDFVMTSLSLFLDERGTYKLAEPGTEVRIRNGGMTFLGGGKLGDDHPQDGFDDPQDQPGS